MDGDAKLAEQAAENNPSQADSAPLADTTESPDSPPTLASLPPLAGVNDNSSATDDTDQQRQRTELRFDKLRLTGFKSFVEATELHIAPGTTGIVGPNGCGKSNLVEALRWVMGENSARKMRGQDMDDVIFGGTERRPARNMAEVVLEIDNSSRTAPAEFNQHEELSVQRRIERGMGSDYRVNGKLVRQRDVQILFADAAIGAHSPAMVSQGKVAAMIAAKPTERRQILEDAAGVSGLHARRHEAELKLKAAENNLTRVEDLLGQLDTQLQGLKKQARQATRYRNLAEQIRKTEAALLYGRWRHASEQLDSARHDFQQLDEQVRNQMLAVAEHSSQHATAAADLPDLRRGEAEAAQRLQKYLLQQEQLNHEQAQLERDLRDTERQLIEAENDQQHEQQRREEAEGNTARLQAEQAELTAAAAAAIAEIATAREQAGKLHDEWRQHDQHIQSQAEQLAAAEAQHNALQRQQRDAEQEQQRQQQRLHQQQQQRQQIEQQIATLPSLPLLDAAVTSAETALQEAETNLRQAEQDAEQRDQTHQQCHAEWLRHDAQTTRLRAEHDALAGLLRNEVAGDLPPVMDELKVQPGYETALAAAFADELQAPLDSRAQAWWQTMPMLDSRPLPMQAEALSAYVAAPAALARILAHIGVVADEETGNQLAPQLAPGQILVSKSGASWRWDGYCVKAGAPTAAAQRLQQRNRLVALAAELAEMSAATDAARAALAQAEQERGAARLATQQQRDALRQLASDLEAKRREKNRHITQLAEAEARLASTNNLLAETDQRLQEIAQRLQQLNSEQQALPDLQPMRDRLVAARAQLAELRASSSAADARLTTLTHDEQTRQQRLQRIISEIQDWQQRIQAGQERIRNLADRHQTASQRLQQLAALPEQLQQRRQELLSQQSAADGARQQAADALQQAENKVGEIAAQLRRAEQQLADAREGRARFETQVQNGIALLDDLAARILEKCDCAPVDVPQRAELSDAELKDPSQLEGRLEKLLRERDNMGPVNLRADIEADEVDAQLTHMRHEQAELVAAIAKLRGAIARLNKDARARLLASFDTVDQHFQRLFARLFNGGQAHLKLTNIDDPLQAGLEIFASPPGKKMQNLGLLSGGEQALTAIALIFAMFLTNPAPICVLDEVDAPLDDANVDRFCSLVEDIAAETGTRFLIITHHRLTMARLDRLYGVTMAENGVSQLVSVDLKQAEEFAA